MEVLCIVGVTFLKWKLKKKKKFEVLKVQSHYFQCGINVKCKKPSEQRKFE